MATDASVGNTVIAQPFISLWNVTSGGVDAVQRIYNTPIGKKLKFAKVWYHALGGTSIRWWKGANAFNVELSPILTAADINKTAGAKDEEAFDRTEPHQIVIIGGTTGQDLMFDPDLAASTFTMSIQIFFEDS